MFTYQNILNLCGFRQLLKKNGLDEVIFSKTY